jgi:hypothetical protein
MDRSLTSRKSLPTPGNEAKTKGELAGARGWSRWDGSGMKDEGSGSEGVMGDGYYMSTLCHSHSVQKFIFNAGPCLLHVVPLSRTNSLEDLQIQKINRTLPHLTWSHFLFRSSPSAPFFFFYPFTLFRPGSSTPTTVPLVRPRPSEAMLRHPELHPLRTDPSLHTTRSPVGNSQRL